jgi:Dullard-like phosphatase family protein
MRIPSAPICEQALGMRDPACTGSVESTGDSETTTTPWYAESLAKIRTFPQPSPEEIASRRVFLGPTTKKCTIALDLDETLIFSYELPVEGEDGDELRLVVHARPGAQDFLERLSTKYEILIFTAAEESYAQEAVALLDPKGRFVSRLLTRQHCIRIGEDVLVKDLRILGDRDLERVLIADNEICSFAFQLSHGIPVPPYTGAEEDNELSSLADYLEALYEEPNLVAANAAEMGLLC